VTDEVDPRFLLANERTFLAWNRTGLALIGGGLAAGQLLDFDSTLAELIVALPPIGLGAALALLSYRRWARNDAALRAGRPLPDADVPRVLPWAIALLAVVIAAVVIVGA
jgi:putative membrane protein